MNAKMKVLALALVGAFGYVGSAAAGTCPAGPTTGEGGAWTQKFINGGSSALVIAATGYDGTACSLQASLGNNGGAQAQVMDDTPVNEAHYRAQFIFDAAGLTGANGGSQTAVFGANAGAVHAGVLTMIRMNFSGSGGGTPTTGKRVIIRTACETGPGSQCGSAPVALPNQTGANRIEFDLVVGANGVGNLRYWIRDVADTTQVDATPDGSITVAGGNDGWIGVDKAFLGMASPTSAYRTVNTDAIAFFDQFDSRRQTFIGN